MLAARTWDQISTIVHAKKATTGMVKCAYQLTPAKLTLETALQSLQCANMMGPDRLTVSVRSITTTLCLEWGAA